MKNLNVKAVLALSLLAFSACDKGGGGNNNTQVVGVPGVIARSYNNGNQQHNKGTRGQRDNEQGNPGTDTTTAEREGERGGKGPHTTDKGSQTRMCC